MSNTIIAVLYVEGEEMMPNCIMDFNALNDMIGKKIDLPVKHGADTIGKIIKLSKKGHKIYATIKLEKDIAYSMRQLGKESKKDKVIITDAQLFELYI